MGRASLPASRGDDGDSIPRSSRGAISGGVAQDGSWRHTPNPLYSADRGTINRNRTCPVVDRRAIRRLELAESEGMSKGGNRARPERRPVMAGLSLIEVFAEVPDPRS